jgi:hypothetical protein
MDAVLEYKAVKSSDSDFEMTIDVSLDSNKGVFRRYLVGNNAVNWIDPLGLFSPSDKGLEEFDDYTSTIKTCSDAVTAPTAADANVECIQCGNAINQYKWLTVSPWSSICMYTWCQNNPDIAGTDSFCTTFVKEKK